VREPQEKGREGVWGHFHHTLGSDSGLWCGKDPKSFHSWKRC